MQTRPTCEKWKSPDELSVVTPIDQSYIVNKNNLTNFPF